MLGVGCSSPKLQLGTQETEGGSAGNDVAGGGGGAGFGGNDNPTPSGGSAGEGGPSVQLTVLNSTDDSGPSSLFAGPDGNLWAARHYCVSVDRITSSGQVLNPLALPVLFQLDVGCSLHTIGPDGNAWFAGASVVRVTPSGTTSLFPGSGRYDTIAAGPDGNVWLTNGNISRVTPAGVITEFPAPNGASSLTSGPDGNLWFAGSDTIGRVTPAGIITEFPTPTPASPLAGIINGPDGNLWFIEQAKSQVGRITPSGVVTEFPLPTPDCSANELVVASDDNVWFTEAACGKIGRITPAGSVTELPVLSESCTTAPCPLPPLTLGKIAAAPGGDLWFAVYESGPGSWLGRMTTTGIVSLYPLPPRLNSPSGHIRDVVALSDGAWFLVEEYNYTAIGHVAAR